MFKNHVCQSFQTNTAKIDIFSNRTVFMPLKGGCCHHKIRDLITKIAILFTVCLLELLFDKTLISKNTTTKNRIFIIAYKFTTVNIVNEVKCFIKQIDL